MSLSFPTWKQVTESLSQEPVLAITLIVALVAMATTPLAFALLGRTEWFKVRRGRVLQKPSFWSVVCSMLLVMALPAMFAALVIKSRYFDVDRYEFDPNQTLTTLDQGRALRSLREANEAVRTERSRLEQTQKELVDSVKQLDEAMLGLRMAALQHPATYDALPGVLDRLGRVHAAIGLDAPQQLMDETAPPVGIPAAPGPIVVIAGSSGPGVSSPAGSAGAAAPEPSGAGLSEAQRQLELASVDEPQRFIAYALPLAGLPAGWTIGEMEGKHFESFNAENLYEKINGRAESFIQYGVKGMAYTYYHPDGDELEEAQLYIYEMGDPLQAFGKYSSEKLEGVETIAIGDEGYVSAGSVFFYTGPFYIQLITTSDDAKLAAFALEIARRTAGGLGAEVGQEAPAMASAAAPEAVAPAPPPTRPASASSVSPAQYFKVLPAGPGRSGDKYVTQDVFGYGFLTNVFLADYLKDDLYWQAFVRPYADDAAAAAMLDTYVKAVREFGAKVREVQVEGAARMVVGDLDGLVDVVFQKGNSLAGINGATDAEAAEAFAREFAASLPGSLQPVPETTPAPAGDPDAGYGDVP